MLTSGNAQKNEPKTNPNEPNFNFIFPSHSREFIRIGSSNEKEARIQQNKEMFEALKNAGHNNVSFTALSDRTHNSIRPNMANEGDQALTLMLEFMKRHGAANIPFENRE
jgi:hypothetical protein